MTLDDASYVLIAVACLVYLVAVTALTVSARRQTSSADGDAARLRIAERWAVMMTRASIGVYIVVVAMMTVSGGFCLGPPLLLALPLLYGPARRQNRLYARLFLGIELPKESK